MKYIIGEDILGDVRAYYTVNTINEINFMRTY